MLRQRIVTALLLLAIMLPALAAQARWPFALFSLVLIAAAAWEWARLNDARGVAAVMWCFLAVVMAGIIDVSGVGLNPQLWWVTTAVWIAGCAWALRLGVSHWHQSHVLMRRVVGLVLLVLAWQAMMQARRWGLNGLLSIFCLVWAADVFAYAGGRLWGRRKLAPHISPGKTWEGVISGLVAVWGLGAAWMQWVDPLMHDQGMSLFSSLRTQFGLLGWFLCLSLLTGLAVVGDLMESLAKRSAGVKDSSGLLPGHGGVLDRVDALLPVFPAAIGLVLMGKVVS